MHSSTLRYNLLITLTALLLFVPFLGIVHLFDWDEINFAECAREMVVTHDYFSVKINYQPFWEKPPIFIWMQAISMNIFGVNEFAARLPNAICGVVTLLVLFNIGRKLYDTQFGLVWIMVYAGSFLPHFYFKSGIIDPWFNLFIFCGIYFLMLFINYNTRIKKNKIHLHLIASALFIGLAALTKGPVAILVIGLCFIVFWIVRRFSPIISIKQILLYGIAVMLVGGLWFLMLYVTGNSSIITEFFTYQVRLFNTQDAGHGGPIWYHWAVLLVGCFPMSVFALDTFKRNQFDTPYQRYFKVWMIILLFVVLILFSLVKTKIVHYSSLCYFPLSFLSAYGVYKLMNGEMKWKNINGILLLFLSLLLGFAISALPLIEKNKQRIINSGIIEDNFAVENFKAQVHWTGYEWMIGSILIIGTIAFLLLMYFKKMKTGLVVIFMCSLIAISTAAVVIAPRIEKYSQNAAIEFYTYLKGKDCYVETIGFKSYAHLFYSNKMPPTNKNYANRDWLLKGDIDKPTYFVSKISWVDDIKEQYPSLIELYRKNGFVFWKRSPATNSKVYSN
ncbi:MAG TPA: glycosyltransferase family 39 protein [Bacteroidia bacterium]|nr:glycosyltransferase family 39 protein [Bacteroidia bacterium]HRG52831.1 glycosyltransferase family 39 protein [Bacteroidia bacterium]